MTRTDVMASSRPLNAAAAPPGAGRRGAGRRLLVPALLAIALALVLPGVAAAAGEGTSGYSQKPEEPKGGAVTPSGKESTGTSPSKEEKTPASTEEKGTSPTASSAKAGTLPFTGLDLRLTVAIGVLLMAAGFSIVLAQRRSARRRS
jgi:hypothetical protein